jgi:hypothetical protein
VADPVGLGDRQGGHFVATVKEWPVTSYLALSNWGTRPRSELA